MQHATTYCHTLQHAATRCTATHCNTLQHTATHCNTLQHIALQGLSELKELFEHAKAYGFEDFLLFDASVVRGNDQNYFYYREVVLVFIFQNCS